jgi:tetratricopeptide (TPR) repeat protein
MDASERQASVVTPGQSFDRHEAETVDVPPETGRELALRCPHCHAPASVWAEGDLAAVKCPECGSDFSLISDRDASDAPLQSVGHFELIEKLGSGAFGTVWKARDTKLDRTVAVKIPRHGSMSADEQQKFFREASAAAQLRHPNIVSVHEVGRDGDTVYIVSDFIRGSTLSDWLTGQKLTSREAAELCAKIADALHHAHEQGVVHRDLKPANIMIDASGQPHLMDFGLARREVGEATVTLDGVLMGTPAYMSPEQAAFKSHTADRRSDVYSLGVILFELLTGERPFRGNIEMIIQQVIQDEPTSPRKLNSNVPKDLETITLKCLEKDPSRRYQSANEFSEEIRRHLSGNPIKARPVGRPERAVRWIQRNKTVSAAMAIAIVALAVGTVVSTLFAIDSRRQAATALAAATQEKKAKETAIARETETAAVLDFVENKIFAAARPEGQEGGLGHDVSLRQAIESALPFVETSFAEQPLIEARLRGTFGTSFFYLGDAKNAVQQYEIARTLLADELGREHLVTLTAMNNLANAYQDAGRWDEAILLHEQTLKAVGKQMGPDHPKTLTLMNNLARAYDVAGRSDEAIQLHEQTLAAFQKKLGSDHPDTLTSMNNLALAYLDSRRLDEALQLLEQCLAARRKKRGPDHPETLTSMNNLADAYVAAGRLEDALTLHEQALAEQRKNLGPNHPNTLRTMGNLASAYQLADRLDEAIPLFEETLASTQQERGPNHPDTLLAMHNLADVYTDAGRADEALPLLEQAVNAMRKVLGPDHPKTLVSINSLARVYLDAHRLNEAITLFEQILAARRQKLGQDHADTLTSMDNLARAYLDADRLNEALTLFEQSLAARRKKLGEDHADTLRSMNNLAYTYDKVGRVNDAMELFLERRDYLSALRVARRADHDQMTMLIEKAIAQDVAGLAPIHSVWVGELRLIAGHAESAEAAIRAGIETAIKRGMNAAKPISFMPQSLGRALLAQGKLDEAKDAFRSALSRYRKVDGTYNLKDADLFAITAAYLVDDISQDEYAASTKDDKDKACFPWFYIGQRREFEGDREAAIAAYKRSVELGDDETADEIRGLSKWRLVELSKTTTESP